MSATVNFEALRHILTEGGIPSTLEFVRDLRRGLHKTSAFFAMLQNGNLTQIDKRLAQKIIFDAEFLSRTLEERPHQIMLLCDNLTREFIALLSTLLSNLTFQGKEKLERLKGQHAQNPETWLFVDLFRLYSALKGTNNIGSGGPHYRFTKASLKYLNLNVAMPSPDSLRKRLDAALKRNEGGKAKGRSAGEFFQVE